LTATLSDAHPMPAVKPDPLYLPYLDGVRGLAALYVVVHHAWMISAQSWTGRTASVARLLFERGHIAVDVFIVLSGFCLMLPVTHTNGIIRGGVRHFFWKRAKRILPPYFVALTLCALAAVTVLKRPTGTLWDRCIPLTLSGAITHVLLVHELFRSTFLQINAVFWSVAVEWKIYFLFPLLVAGFRKFGAAAAALFAIPLSYLLLMVLRHTPINTDTAGVSCHYIGLFVLGMMGAEIGFSAKAACRVARTRVPWMAMVFIASIAALLASRVKLRHENLTPFNDLFIGIWSAVLLTALAIRKQGILHRAAAWRPLAFLGTFGYSLYLIHLPLLQLFWQYGLAGWKISPGQELAMMLLIAVPLATVAAYLFFLAFERPFLTRRRTREVKLETSVAL
jgi:peptidoglycan/LPS O-acetylase OafA/YrhL